MEQSQYWKRIPEMLRTKSMEISFTGLLYSSTGSTPQLKICQWNPDASHQFETKINSMADVGMERY
jgi:hypothetical protein